MGLGGAEIFYPLPRQAVFVGSEHRVQGVYTGCPRDAHRFFHGTSGEHPLYTPCTPLVHGAWVPRTRLGMVGIRRLSANDAFGQFLAVSCRLKLWRGASPILAFSLSLPTSGAP